MTDTTETVDAVVLNPRTGELVSLDAPLEELAAWLEDVRSWQADFLRPCVRACEEAILARMDHDAKYTLRAGGLEVTGDGPGRLEYDESVLRDRLRPLVDNETISRDAYQAAVKEVVTYKPMARGINALRKLGGDVEAAIEAAAHPSEKPRRVSVKRGPR